MADEIPNELLVDILARLPVVSVLRFKSVCKSWHSLITSPSFVTKHINHSKANSDKVLLGLYVSGQRRYLLCRVNELFGDEFSELELPIEMSPSLPPFENFHVEGSVNGILFLQVGFSLGTSQIILWNPSIRKLVTLPKPEAMPMLLLGFGVHPTTHEYKVVTIAYETYPRQPASPTIVYVYTQGTGWRKLGSTFPPYCFVKYWAPQVFVNGAVNWIGKDPRVSIGYRNFIVSFDMSAETFSVLTLPPTLANQETVSLSVKDYQGSLAVLCDRERDNGACCMWVMKEYGVSESWTKLFSFKLDLPLKSALGFWKHGEVLLWTRGNRFLSYDVGTKALTDILISESVTAVHDVVPYMETLVLLKN